MDFPFQQGEWILVVFATNKTKKYSIGVTVFVNKGNEKWSAGSEGLFGLKEMAPAK
jgi:hypothetical protein